jgi:hypothetical protein
MGMLCVVGLVGPVDLLSLKYGEKYLGQMWIGLAKVWLWGLLCSFVFFPVGWAYT